MVTSGGLLLGEQTGVLLVATDLMQLFEISDQRSVRRRLGRGMVRVQLRP